MANQLNPTKPVALRMQISEEKERLATIEKDAAAQKARIKRLEEERKANICAFEDELLKDTQALLKKILHNNRAMRPLKHVILAEAGEKETVARGTCRTSYACVEYSYAYRCVGVEPTFGIHGLEKDTRESMLILAGDRLPSEFKKQISAFESQLAKGNTIIHVNGFYWETSVALSRVMAFYLRTMSVEDAIKQTKKFFEENHWTEDTPYIELLYEQS